MFIVNHRKIWYALSAVLLSVSIWALLVLGLNYGIEFKGGSLIEVSYIKNVPSIEFVKNTLLNQGFPEASVRTSGENNYIIRIREISPAELDTVVDSLSMEDNTLVLKDFNVVGPTLGSDAKNKSIVALVLVLIFIVIFIAFAFRKVSQTQGNKLTSWTYGVVAILALLHDILIPVGVFSFLGYYLGFEVDTLFVTALLVILGFSVHDTIVVFDRVRENLIKYESKKQFEQIVGESVSETIARSINTSLTTLFAIAVLYIWGPESTRHFALTMGIGILVGTYSSIFFASPLLVTINKWKSKMG